MSATTSSYLIVGAGVFGVSTAYHLIRKYPNASITILDRDAHDAESRVAASWDWNKVVRADYDDFLYCRLALEAQQIFTTDALWKPYFHQTGVYWMCRSNYARDVIRNHEKMGHGGDIQAVSVEEAKKMYGGLFADADYQGVTEVLINKGSGWAAAGDCLKAVTERCLELGVKYVVGEAKNLVFDKNRRCRGVRLQRTEQVIRADKVVLCTGAYTAKLLEMSAMSSGISELGVGDRIVAGGITTGMAQLDDESYQRFADMPVGFQGYTAETGPFIGSLPPTKDRELKWWGPTIFSNTLEVSPGTSISMPPSDPDYAQWKVSKRLREDIDYANKVFYGNKGANWKMCKYRICWDAFTSSGDFIISPHPASEGLYVATCGSFHGYKFFPVLGKYITQMLEGQLEDELRERWAWNRERPDPALNGEWPRVEMRELLDTTPRL